MDDIIITEKNIFEFKGDFGDPNIVKQIETIEQDFVQSGSVGDAYDFLKHLQVAIKNLNLSPDNQSKYDEMILLLQFTAFPLLETDEQINLLSQNLKFAFKKEIDLKDRIHLVFFPYFDNSQSQELSMLLRAMQSNIEPIETKTIGKWIEDYNKSKQDSRGGTISVIDYITKSSDARSLESNSSDLLKSILLLFDWMRYSAIPKEFLTSSVPRTQEFPQNRTPVKIGSLQSRPQTPTPPRRPVSNFDQKLTQVSAPPAHGQDLEVLREQLEKTQTDADKNRGLTRTEMPRPSQPASVKMTPAEIKREVTEIELPGHKEEIARPNVPSGTGVASSPPRFTQKIEAPRKDERPITPPPKAPPTRTNLQSLAQISMVDDLKKIEIAHLRQGPLSQQLQTIRSKIFSIAQANRLYPYYTVNAFEQSPLFRAYLQTGSSKITENKTEGGLSQAEFEAIADFKKEIERL